MTELLNTLITFLLGVLVGGLWMRSLALDTLTELVRDPKFWALIQDVWDEKERRLRNDRMGLCNSVVCHADPGAGAVRGGLAGEAQAVNFYIAGELTTLNDFIAATNRNRWAGASIKRDETRRVMLACRELPPISHYPISLHLTWFRSNKKSDPDNVAFAVKFILDGMQDAGVIAQDNWKAISRITHDFRIDADNPGVEIVIETGG